MNIKWKELLIAIAIPLSIGLLSGLISKDSMITFDLLNKPIFSPPGWLFPVVWTILYILMGISSYLIYISSNPNKTIALTLYSLQLFFNFFWSILFFNFNLYIISFVWIVILWILIIMTIISFYSIDKNAAYLLVPYLLWVTFASYLNYAIALLNKN